jgi:GT2 family glycosyltransferase
LNERPGAGMRPTATVAICTRDRTEDLKRCLHGITAMPDDGQQVMVVDNAPSTEATRELVAAYPGIRYVREERPGLDVARNRALREAETEIIAFTDDDAMPDPLWLRALLGNFEDPLVMASTGVTMPLELETDAQIRFQQLGGFVRGFKRVVYDAGAHEPLLGWLAGAGVNMAVRRNVLQQVGAFDEALDAGTTAHAGGDYDMFRRILTAGYRIIYDPRALAWHRHRRTEGELKRQLVGYEVAAGAVLSRALFVDKDLGVLRETLRLLRDHLRGLSRSLRRRPGAHTTGLQLALMSGLFNGVFAYLASPRRAGGR